VRGNRHVDIVVRRLPVVATAFVVTIAAAIAAWSALPTSYRAAALLHVPTAPVGQDWRQYDLDYADRLMHTYVTLAQSGRVRLEVAARLGVVEAPPLEVEVLPNTELMRAAAIAATPEAAAAAANVLADVLIGLGVELTQGVVLPAAPPTPQVVEPAAPPLAPRGPGLPIVLLVAAVLGGIAGVFLAYVLERLDGRLFDERELARLLGRPLLASVPRFRGAAGTGLAAADDPAGHAFAVLAAHVTASHAAHEHPLVVVVVGVAPGVGASTTAANLATALAGDVRRVLVLDTEGADGRQAELLAALPRGRGVASARALATAVEGVRLLPTRVADVPTLLREAQGLFDVVVIDAAPLSRRGDAVRLGSESDAIVAVARRGRSRAIELSDAREALESVDAPLLGVVVTDGGATANVTVAQPPAVPARRAERTRTGDRSSLGERA
jgi:Mrp family chromosome partitioning ATPase/capsular polysaccharide biosynthesis protein